MLRRILALGLGALALVPAAASAQNPLSADPPAPATVQRPDKGPLADDRLSTTVRRLARGGRAAAGVDVVRGRVRVEVLVEPKRRSATAAAIARAGGRVEGTAGRSLLQALVPPKRLAALERSPGVRTVRRAAARERAAIRAGR